MEAAQKNQNESLRLNSLRNLNILDSEAEAEFDQLVILAAKICQTPMALITFVDENRVWLKARKGIAFSEVPIAEAFCTFAVKDNKTMTVVDAFLDERFFANPNVVQSPSIRFYSGAIIRSPEGFPIGTLCVLDVVPRNLSSEQIADLELLALQVTRLIELQQKVKNLKYIEQDLLFKNKAFENIAEGVVYQDSKGVIVGFNPAALKLLGLTADELTGRTSHDNNWQAVHEDGHPFHGDEHPAMICLRTGTKQSHVIMGIKSSFSEVRWLKVISVPIFNEASLIPNYVVTSFSDVTTEYLNQKTIEAEARAKQFILDSIPFPVGQWNLDGICLMANKSYSQFLGKSLDQIIGRNLKELGGENSFGKSKEFIELLKAGKTVKFEKTFAPAPGQIYEALVSLIPNVVDGQVNSFLAVLADITELRRLETERQSEAQRIDGARLLAVSNVSQGMAHEINNPLAILQGRVSALKAKLISQRFDESQALNEFKAMELTIERIAKITRGLLVFSSATKEDQHQLTNLNSVIENTLLLCREKFLGASIQIKVSCNQNLKLECSPTQISRIFMNLLSNSFDALQDLEEKWIEINVSESTDQVTILVIDSGNGIEKEVSKLIMDPFFTTKEVGKGTGLGLSIAFGLAQSHGGSLRFLPLERHTTFELILKKNHLSKNH